MSTLGGGVSLWVRFWIRCQQNSLCPHYKSWPQTIYTKKSAFSTAFQPCMTLVCQHVKYRWFFRLFAKKRPNLTKNPSNYFCSLHFAGWFLPLSPCNVHFFLHGRIRLGPGYTPGPVNHPNVSCKIGFCDVFSQCHSSNWVFDFIFSCGFPPFLQRLASISFELIGSTGPVFHDESGHATQIRPRPL